MGDSAYASPDTIDLPGTRRVRGDHQGPGGDQRPGMFTKDDFGVDVERERVVCGLVHRADPVLGRRVGAASSSAPAALGEQCTTAVSGRTTVHREDILQRKKRSRPAASGQAAAYRGDRPKERKIAHFMRVMRGGRAARSPRARTCPDRRRHLLLSSTWPAWRLSTLPSPTVVGQQQRHDRYAGEEPILNAGQRPEVPAQDAQDSRTATSKTVTTTGPLATPRRRPLLQRPPRGPLGDNRRPNPVAARRT